MSAEPLLKDFESAEAALRELCACVDETDASLLGGVEVEPSSMPESFRGLLDHRGHMTPRLSAYHGEPVALTVLAERREGAIYNRKIVLTAPRAGAVVELGIVRLNLSYTRDEVRAEILERGTPLGDILNGHDVLTRVDPQWFLRFPSRGTLRETFGVSNGASLFGRIGTIYMHELPAVELLEIVTQRRQA